MGVENNMDISKNASQNNFFSFRPFALLVLFITAFPIQSLAQNGAGIPGSPTMIKLNKEWRPMHESEAKQRGRDRFNKNKYGMFIHWGLYSQVGGVWKGKTMEEEGNGPLVAEWVMRRKEIPRTEYAKLADTFNPDNFDAKEWVAIAKAAGMKYIVITSKHHDGFALFDSAVSDFNAVDGTPFGRDIIQELSEASKEAGIAFGVYYSHALDWRDGGDAGWKDHAPENPLMQRALFINHFDPSPLSFKDYIDKKSLPQVRELIARYELSQIWFDTPVYIPPEYSLEFYKTVYDANPEILVSQRVGNGFGDIGTPGDNVIPSEASANTWEGIATTNHSWGYKSYDNDWKSPVELLYWLVENVSKGGNFLLNVGPDGSGTIPAESVNSLRTVGSWLKVNGEAIYDTNPWEVNHEGPTQLDVRSPEYKKNAKKLLDFKSNDFWFTEKSGKVYVIALARPETAKIAIQSLHGKPVQSIRVLGESGKVSWSQGEQSLDVSLPALESTTTGYVLEVTFQTKTK